MLVQKLSLLHRNIVVSGVIILTSSPVVSVDLILDVFDHVIKRVDFRLFMKAVHSYLVESC